MRKRNVHLQLWLSPKESQRLKELVKKSGLAQSAYLRHLINGLVPNDEPPPDYYAMMQELYRVGNSLHQIALAAHTLNVIDAQNYDHTVSLFKQTVETIINAVIRPRSMAYPQRKDRGVK